ncbi:FAD-dependent oxidoreductase [Metabacillus sp. KIGAM252]|uniref:FAD-dependent oxidoreductase n=1 Tax=Metabacillus flavus TaxID=2823519 RepID=A0ABS5L9Q0_9BACI|nr:FAD-dependent oxidoreductase [Metabacillus flavus]MBS2967442.1 FAD-dependent oxidoreductase [Metabacillus flavus]
MNTIILAGGGHAHLAGIADGSLRHFPHTEIILISPSRYQYYSGMFSGFTEGIYSENQIRIDLEALSKKHGFTFVEDKITGIDADGKSVLISSGRTFTYDLLSFDIGSSQIRSPFILPIKPNYTFPEAIRSFREGERPVIVGGGASGVELSLAASAYRKHNSLMRPVSLISGVHLLSSAHSQKLHEVCEHKGVNVIQNKKARLLDSGVLVIGDDQIPFSHLLWLGGAEAPSLFKQSSLATDANGYLQVDERLRYSPSIFAAGDCVSINRYPQLPKNGVYAVRQSTVLWENLKRAAEKRDLVPFRPQKQFLAILSTGGKEGFLTYGRIHYHGKTAWTIKHAIDRRYMNSF